MELYVFTFNGVAPFAIFQQRKSLSSSAPNKLRVAPDHWMAGRLGGLSAVLSKLFSFVVSHFDVTELFRLAQKCKLRQRELFEP